MKELRPYQRTAVDRVSEYWNENTGNCLIVLPTGSGKSLVNACFIREAIEQWPETRILVLTHVRELIAQGFQELISHWPEAPAGIYSAGLGKRDIRSQVLFAGIQSIHSKAYALQRVDIVVIDEIQLVPRRSNTTYRKLLNDLKQINPWLKVLGLTATPFRLDSGRLHVGDDALFSDIAYEANIKDLMDDGYLSPLITVAGTSQIDTSNVGTRAGDFISGQLEAVADEPETVRAIADEIVANSEGRRGILVFGCGVAHCKDLRDALRDRGISCEGIFGDTPTQERDAIISGFKSQRIRALTSMGVLTVGFDARHVDLISIARPTKSTGLFIQICGRGTRLHPGKENCLILDHGNNIQRHGPIDAPIIKDKKKVAEDTAAPTKNCPECGTPNFISAHQCIGCGYEFPEVASKISTQASQLAILSGINRTEWVDVTNVFYRKHEKEGKPPSVCVTYSCGLSSHKTWQCFSHQGFARSKAVAWWRQMTKQNNVPASTDEALAQQSLIRKPAQIAIRPAGRYHDVVGYRFADEIGV